MAQTSADATTEATEGKFLDLVAAYFVGDPDAINVIDTAVEVAGTLAWVHTSPHTDNYHEIRQECDEAIDMLVDSLASVERNGWLVTSDTP